MGREIIIGQEMPQWKHSATRYGHVTTVCGGHQPCHSPGHLMYASERKMEHQEKAFLERSGSLQQSTVDADLGPVSTHSSSICWQPPTHQGCRQDLTVSPRLGNPALSTTFCLLLLPSSSILSVTRMSWWTCLVFYCYLLPSKIHTRDKCHLPCDFSPPQNYLSIIF